MIFPLAKKNISLSQLLVAGGKSNHALVGKESHLMCSSNNGMMFEIEKLR